jgi:hypothetical protein
MIPLKINNYNEMKHDLKFEGTNIKMIKTESDYQAALKRLETIAELFDVNVPAKSKHLNFFLVVGNYNTEHDTIVHQRWYI